MKDANGLSPPARAALPPREAARAAREAIARARPGRPADALCDLPDAARVVPLLPAQDLMLAIKGQGLCDSLQLLSLCSPAQARALIDMDVWRGDRLLAERLFPWLDALAALGLERLEDFGRLALGLDLDVVEWALCGAVRVHEADPDRPIETELPVWASPDRFFECELLGDEDRVRGTVRLLDLLYRADLERARLLLQEAAAGTASELEEDAYRARAGRMADLGFPDPIEALAAYADLDPASVRIGEGSRSGEPSLAADVEPDEARPGSALLAAAPPPRGEDFWARACALVADDGERERLSLDLVALANRVLVADRLDAGDPAAIRAGLERTRATLSLGLEFVCRGDEASASEALGTVALARLFRAGHALTVRLARTARVLARGAEAMLLDSPWRDLLGALLLRRPRYSPAGEGIAGDPRPFSCMREVRRATEALEEAAASIALCARLGIDAAALDAPDFDDCLPARDDVRLGDLVRTRLAHAAVGHDPVLLPLSPADLDALFARGVDRAAAERALRAAAPPGVPAPVVDRLVRHFLDPLDEELGSLRPPIDPRFVTGLVRRARPPASG